MITVLFIILGIVIGFVILAFLFIASVLSFRKWEENRIVKRRVELDKQRHLDREDRRNK